MKPRENLSKTLGIPTVKLPIITVSFQPPSRSHNAKGTTNVSLRMKILYFY